MARSSNNNFLCGVFGVDADVIVGEVAGVGFGTGFAHVQTDGDIDFLVLHFFLERRQRHAFNVLAILHQRNAVQNDFEFFRFDRHPGTANSLLVKTALFGEDPNWGRIIAAVGSAGVPIKPENSKSF